MGSKGLGEEMKEDQINSLLSWLLEALKGTQGLVLSQAPDLIKQILLYEMIARATWIVVTTVLVYICYRTVKYGIEADKKDRFSDMGMPCKVIGSVCGVVSVFSFLYSVETLSKVVFTPKLFVFEYVSGQIENHK